MFVEAKKHLLLTVVLCYGWNWIQFVDGELNPLHPHTHMTTTELIQARGYPAEEHEVLTDDGYYLTFHRIPSGRTTPWKHRNSTFTNSRISERIPECYTSERQPQRPVVFLQHGVHCSSADFVVNDPHQALGFVLADMGYDVWLGNTRGNPYGLRHVSLSPQDLEFWDFSWDTMSEYDMPAMLQYVRRTTGASKMDYIGHSMGTTIFFTMMNYHPHINTWIRKMAALTPSAYIHNAFAGYRLLAPFYNFHNDYLPVIMAHTPAGVNSNILAHYSQLVMSRKYQAFDYGRRKNLHVYGHPHPPLFNLSAVTAPVGLFWSDDDWINSPADVQQILMELPNVIFNYKIPHKNFNHIDFIWSEYAYDYVYVPLMRFLNFDRQCIS